MLSNYREEDKRHVLSLLRKGEGDPICDPRSELLLGRRAGGVLSRY